MFSKRIAYDRIQVAEILKIVDQELGSCGSDLDDLVQGQKVLALPCSNGILINKRSAFEKIYLYISEKYRVQGCLQVEKIAEGFRVIPGHMATDLAANEQCCGSIIARCDKLWNVF